GGDAAGGLRQDPALPPPVADQRIVQRLLRHVRLRRTRHEVGSAENSALARRPRRCNPSQSSAWVRPGARTAGEVGGLTRHGAGGEGAVGVGVWALVVAVAWGGPGVRASGWGSWPRAVRGRAGPAGVAG